MTIDANMYWLPEELFTNEKMLEEFMKMYSGSIWSACKMRRSPGHHKETDCAGRTKRL